MGLCEYARGSMGIETTPERESEYSRGMSEVMPASGETQKLPPIPIGTWKEVGIFDEFSSFTTLGSYRFWASWSSCTM